MRKNNIIWIFISLFFILLANPPSLLAAEGALEDALFKGNWQGVIEILEKDDSKANDPVARLLMAHASLATNKNNESMLLFLSVKEEGDLKLWQKWTDSLLGKHPQNPIALYLSADAKARQGRLKDAEEMFTKALAVKGDFALAYNLRGILYALNGEISKAMEDFNTAIRLNPNLTDAYYNRGLLYSHTAEYQKSLEEYTKAIDINPSGLVYNGRGVVYWQLGRYDLALNDLEVAKGLVSAFPTIDGNIAIILRQKAQTEFKSQLATGEKVAGRLEFYFTDFGINQWKADLKTGDDFSKASNKVFTDIPKSGQILIVMPPDLKFLTTPKEQLTKDIFETLKARVDGGLAVGNTRFEIQLVQHILLPGYVDPIRQGMVNDFGESAYRAIGMLNDYVKSKGLQPSNYGICGSNGCKVFTENIPAWKSYASDIRGVSMYDGRAFKTPTIETIKTLGEEKLHFYNTLGDALAPNLLILHSIGNHDVVKEIKGLHPGIISTLLNPIDRPNLPPLGHIAGMTSNSRFLAKDVIGQSYTTPKEITSHDLRQEEMRKVTMPTTSNTLPNYWTYNDRPKTESKVMAGFGRPEMGKVLVVGSGERADIMVNDLKSKGLEVHQILNTGSDYQKIARDIGAKAIFGVRSENSIKLENSTKLDTATDLKKIPPWLFQCPPPCRDGGSGGASGGLPGSFRIPSTTAPQLPGDKRSGVVMPAEVVNSEVGGMGEMLGETQDLQTSPGGLERPTSPFLVFPYLIL